MRKLLDGDSDVGTMSNLKQAHKSPNFFFFSRPEQMMKVTIWKEHAHLRLTRQQDLLKSLPRFSGPCVLVQNVPAIWSVSTETRWYCCRRQPNFV